VPITRDFMVDTERAAWARSIGHESPPNLVLRADKVAE
jgi:hypothetical protein